MKKIAFIIISLIQYTTLLLGQDLPQATGKPPIDHSVYDKWPEVGSPRVSNNGAYAMYTIYNMPAGNNTLVIQSTNKVWKKEFIGVADAQFTQDNNQAIFKMPGDSLCLLKLGTEARSYIPYVSSYRITGESKGEWLAYHLKTPTKDLVLRNLQTGEEKKYLSVNDYYFTDNGKVLLLLREAKKDSTIANTLQWISLSDGKVVNIWRGNKAGNFAFNTDGTQLAFIGEWKNGENPNIFTLWYYHVGMDSAIARVNDQTPTMDDSLIVENSHPRFSRDGNKLFFSVRSAPQSQSKGSLGVTTKVNIWNYKDELLHPLQSNESPSLSYEAVINAGSDSVILLTGKNDRMISNADGGGNEAYVLVQKQIADGLERNWQLSARPSFYIVSTRDATRKLVKEHLLVAYGSLSPGCKYVIYYDAEKRHYFVYNIANGTTINVTQQISIPLYDEENDHPEAALPHGVAITWLPNDTGVIVYDRYDIWKVDPEGIKPPMNITGGYGRKHKTVLRLVYEDRAFNVLLAQKHKTLLLSGFNRITKFNGFYSKQLGMLGDPELLTTGPYIYHLPSPSPLSFIGNTFAPLKARDADTYIVRRLCATQAPNYYCTSDFKTYTQLSNIQPQRSYNWMTSELVHWKTLDGSQTEGILYKPENFDSTKKYPVILYFYEKLADGLNDYLRPEASGGVMNIPYFVSNGYLVFAPDIHYKIGEPGESAYNSVVSAANYLAKMPWVDSNKMGIQGHSFGGYEVNYLVTRTSIFAAAASAAGPSDFISGYGGLQGSSNSNQGMYEIGQSRIGFTLWEKPELYIKNSPIFKADKVSTPLLMMHNKEDDAVPFQQGVEFFTALRRLGKKVWMLQYDGHGHQVGGKEAVDYSVRLAQFFDYYLRDTLPPKWMTEGAPAQLKGGNLGLELDASGKHP